jgi:hypothetical protein
VRACDNAFVIQKMPTCPDREATRAVKWSCCTRKSAVSLFLDIPEVNVYCAYCMKNCFVCVFKVWTLTAVGWMFNFPPWPAIYYQ